MSCDAQCRSSELRGLAGSAMAFVASDTRTVSEARRPAWGGKRTSAGRSPGCGKPITGRMSACQQFSALTRQRGNSLWCQRVFTMRPLPFFIRRSLIASIITSWVVMSASRPTSLIMR